MRLPTLIAAALSLAMVSAPARPVHAQTEAAHGVEGEWREPGGSVIRIAPCGADVCATLIQIRQGAPSQFDIHNHDAALRSRPLCGLRIGTGFHLNGPINASDGKLYDPKNGKTYSGSMASAGDTLNLRGYVLFSVFGRTESWTRVHGIAPCTPPASAAPSGR